MGHKRDDGDAVDVSATGSTVFNYGDLYRLGGITGFALSAKTAAQTDRGMALEINKNHVWKALLPAGVTPAVGDLLYWTAGTGLKKGDTDITATPTGQPVVQVVEAKNAGGYAALRLTGLQ